MISEQVRDRYERTSSSLWAGHRGRVLLDEEGDEEMKCYTVQKTYFRNDPRFGRTTTLLKNGVVVLVLMGVVSKRAIVAQYEGRL